MQYGGGGGSLPSVSNECRGGGDVVDVSTDIKGEKRLGTRDYHCTPLEMYICMQSFLEPRTIVRPKLQLFLPRVGVAYSEV